MRSSYMKIVFAILFLIGGTFAAAAHAQPTDAQLRQRLTAPRTISITLGAPGKIEWSSTYRKYVWSRNFTARLRTEEPGVVLIVRGYASYDVMGGRYVFWRSFTTSNSYDGIPDPTESEIQGLVRKFEIRSFIRDYYYNRIVGGIESFRLAEDPKYEWHTPNSVSFNMVAVYTIEPVGPGTNQRGAQGFRVRLYRDNTRSEWKNVLSSETDWKPL